MREILTGIFSWPWFSQPHGYNFNGHFIRHADGNLCIDPVEPTDEVLKEMVSHGVARIYSPIAITRAPRTRYVRVRAAGQRFMPPTRPTRATRERSWMTH